MAAEFLVRGTWVLEDRGLFAVAGVIEDGMVEMGMTATLEGQKDSFTRRVHSVELMSAEPMSVDLMGEQVAGESGPVLLFSFSGPAKLAAWQALDWDGRTLSLTW
ncbi:MAG TPA: hypothetical protein VGA70_08740 [Longimicrobiales bacterium]|jgi:hypothetical protein